MKTLKYREVYLSGPMTGIEDHGIPAFAAAHAKINGLMPKGVYDPGQEALRLRSIDPDDHDSWMTRSLHELTRPDLRRHRLLVSLPGWERSEGATIERAVAEACGIACADLDEILEEYGAEASEKGNEK